MRFVVEHHHPPEHRGIAPELRLPQRVREHDALKFPILRRERSARSPLLAEHPEEFRL
jgi:hypothetical protein